MELRLERPRSQLGAQIPPEAPRNVERGGRGRTGARDATSLNRGAMAESGRWI